MDTKTTEEQLYEAGWIMLLLGIVLAVIYFKVILKFAPNMPCFLYTFFHLYCPGCGGTRAVLALCKGHALKAIWYHPIVPYTAFLYSGFMLSHFLERRHVPKIKGWKFHNWYLFVAVGLVLANVVLKNILLVKFHIAMD